MELNWNRVKNTGDRKQETEDGGQMTEVRKMRDWVI
jgi:hypothetical protein